VPENRQTGVTVLVEGVPMFRRILALASFAVLVSAAGFAQVATPVLVSAPVSRTVFLSLDAVQAQVDATVRHAAASMEAVATAVALPPLALRNTGPRR